MNTTESTPQDSLDLRDLRGLIATVNLTGTIQQETNDSLLHMALWNAEHGFTNVEYRSFPAQLVEAGRDEVCRHALSQSYDWLLMFDGDAVFTADALARMIHTAFIEVPDSDVVGAYAQLKHNYVPTIDTGTGTWEPIFPHSGTLPVIRTGGHFLLIKTPILRKIAPAGPWFRTRQQWRPIDALRELDNYARIKLDGRNPFADSEAWQRLAELARKESAPDATVASVGEDSGFCDRVTSVGGRIYVNTDIVTGHVAKRIIQPSDLRDAMRERERKFRLACGVLD